MRVGTDGTQWYAGGGVPRVPDGTFGTQAFRRVPRVPDTTQALPPAELIEAAMTCCDWWGDSEQARQQMVADISAVPPDQWADLTDYFTAIYGSRS